MRFKCGMHLPHTRAVGVAENSDASNGEDLRSCRVPPCLSAAPMRGPLSNTYPSAESATGLKQTWTADSKDRGLCKPVACSHPKKRARVEVERPQLDHQRADFASMASMQRCLLQVDTSGIECVKSRSAQNISDAPRVTISPAETKGELLPWMDGGPVGTVQQVGSCSSNRGELPYVRSSFEAVLSAFPFLLPIVEGKSTISTSRAALSTGAHVRTEDQPRQIWRAAVEGLSEVAADLAVEMNDLRRSGEQLAELLPGGGFSLNVGSRDSPNQSDTPTCSDLEGRNSLDKSTDKSSSLPVTYLWCDCVASVTASIESSVLSVLYEKEALHLFQQDVLDTKFQWWRAVTTCFAGRSQLETVNAGSPIQPGQKCCLPAVGLSTGEVGEKQRLLHPDMALKDNNNHCPLQRWAGCCFCSPVSLAYLMRAHEQLYIRDKALRPPLQTANYCAVVSVGDRKADEMSTNDSGVGVTVKTGEKKLRYRTGAQKEPHQVTTDSLSDALTERRLPVASVVHKGYDCDAFEGRAMCGLQSDTERRRQIWQWLWEAAGALGFCASSRFLAMQLLDAYLQHEKCTVDVSNTTQIATAAVAAVLLAAASRCHWRDVTNDAFLLTLLRQLELPSSADDVIQMQADMLRLLPTFLFTVKTPVDYLVCFLANLRWLPQVLEHNCGLELTSSQELGADFVRNNSTNAKADASLQGSFLQRPVLRQNFHSVSVGFQGGEEQSPDGGCKASTSPEDVHKQHTEHGKNIAYGGRTSEACGIDANSIARGISPVLLTRTASHGMTPLKEMVSLFDYWRCTGLLGCLEGLMLRCCSAFISCATLCARVPMSRVLAVLLLQVFEPYSRYRLQHPQEIARGVLSIRNSGDIKGDTCPVSKERLERINGFGPSVIGSWPAGLLEWCRCISTNVFRMHFDADLLFWKLLLQPLIDQLLHLPENRPFLVLWQRGVKEWASLLERCSRATRRNKDNGADGSHTMNSSCPPAKGFF